MKNMIIGKRIHQIDLLRFFAAISVMLYHYLFRGWAANDRSALYFEKFGSFFKYGYLGVDLFFIISGFVIIGSIKHRSISKFIISRISRLYPVYWICVLLTYLVIVFLGTPKYDAEFYQLIWNLSMFQNYFGIESIDGVYWTLFIEMKFYIFVVGFYLLINKIKETTIDNIIIIWLLISFFKLLLPNLFLLRILNYVFILDWSAYFIAGMVFYQMRNNGANIKYFVLLVICYLLSIYYALGKIEHLELKYHTNFSPNIIGLVILMFFGTMLMISVNRLKYFNSRRFLYFGMLTYPLYLIHQNIGYIIFNRFNNDINKYLLVVMTITLMIGISFVLSRFYEPFVSNLIRKILKNYFSKLKNKLKGC